MIEMYGKKTGREREKEHCELIMKKGWDTESVGLDGLDLRGMH